MTCIRICLAFFLFFDQCIAVASLHNADRGGQYGFPHCSVVNWTLTTSTMLGICGAPLGYEQNRGPTAVGCNSSDTPSVQHALANAIFPSCYSRCLFGLNLMAYAWNGNTSCWVRSAKCLAKIADYSDQHGTMEERVQKVASCPAPGPPLPTLSCSATCGKGQFTLIGEPCENYDGCEFSILCPFGEGEGSEPHPVSCHTQVILVILAICCVACFIVLIIMKYLATVRRRIEKNRHRGHYPVNDEVGKVEYRIRYPNDYLHLTPAEKEQFIDEKWEDSQVEQKDADGKIHVLWCLDDDMVRVYSDGAREKRKVLPGGVGVGDEVISKVDYANQSGESISKGDEGTVMGGGKDGRVLIVFGDYRVQLAPQQFRKKGPVEQQLAIEDDAPKEEAIVSQGQRGGAHDAVDIDDGRAFVEEPDMDLDNADIELAIPEEQSTGTPMYEDGARVEYYSRHKGRWIAAEIRLEHDVNNNAEGSDEASLTIHYHVHLRDGSLKERVPVYCIRRPLEFGEYVEVSLIDGHTLAGEIFGIQYMAAANIGYKVRLAGKTQALEGIPANRLRLRFPPFAKVSIYEGAHVGWVEGVVAGSVPPDGLGLKPIKFNGDDPALDDIDAEMDFKGTVTEAEDTKMVSVKSSGSLAKPLSSGSLAAAQPSAAPEEPVISETKASPRDHKKRKTIASLEKKLAQLKGEREHIMHELTVDEQRAEYLGKKQGVSNLTRKTMMESVGPSPRVQDTVDCYRWVYVPVIRDGSSEVTMVPSWHLRLVEISNFSF